MTADAVGGVWQYTTELARALGAHGVEVVIAVTGPWNALPLPVGERVASPQARSGEGEKRCAMPGKRILTPPLPDPLPNGEREFHIIPTTLPLDWLCDSPAPVLSAAEAIAALAREVGADVVQVNSPTLACARFDQPVVAVAHGCVATWWEAAEAGPLSPDFAWHAALMREGLLAADATVAPTRAYAEAVHRRYTLPRALLAVHNGRTPLALPPALRTDHALTAGRLWDRVKRTALLDRVAALTPIRAAGPIAAPHGETVATEHLHLLGTLDAAALARELAGRPVFVSAATFEPFGLAVLEAAQAGCPLVLSDIATFRELWDGAALFVGGDEPEVWAGAIGRAKADRDTLGAAARARAARYTPEANAAAMLDIYTRLLAPASVRAEPVEARGSAPAVARVASPSTSSGRTESWTVAA